MYYDSFLGLFCVPRFCALLLTTSTSPEKKMEKEKDKKMQEVGKYLRFNVPTKKAVIKGQKVEYFSGNYCQLPLVLPIPSQCRTILYTPLQSQLRTIFLNLCGRPSHAYTIT